MKLFVVALLLPFVAGGLVVRDDSSNYQAGDSQSSDDQVLPTDQSIQGQSRNFRWKMVRHWPYWPMNNSAKNKTVQTNGGLVLLLLV